MYVVLIISFYVSFFSLLLSCLPLPHSSPSSLVTCIRFVTMGRCTTARENPDDPLNPHTLLTQLDEKCPLDLTHLDDNAIVLLIQANCFLPQLRKPKVLWDRAKEIRGLVMQRYFDHLIIHFYMLICHVPTAQPLLTLICLLWANRRCQVQSVSNLIVSGHSTHTHIHLVYLQAIVQILMHPRLEHPLEVRGRARCKQSHFSSFGCHFTTNKTQVLH